MTAYSHPPHDPTAVMGPRLGAFLIDVFLIGAAWMATMVPMFMSVAEEAPTNSNAVICSGDRVGDGGSSRDRGSESTGGANTGGIIVDRPITDSGADAAPVEPSFCFHSGDTTYYIPVAEEGSFQRNIALIGLGISAVNLLVIQGITGASIGKLVVGLRVVRRDGERLGFGRHLLRWVALMFSWFCCILVIVDLVMAFSSKGHRRIGDHVADSFVVKKGSVGQPIVTEPGAQPQGWGGPGFGPPPGGPAQTGWPAGPGSSPISGDPWTPQSPPSDPSTPSGDGPTWDPARNAYIQYDREIGAWMQWDDRTRAWVPITQ